MKRGKIFCALLILSSLPLLASCTTMKVGGEIRQGSRALLLRDYDRALTHFQKAAKIDPNYITNFTLLKQGVWTYVGRAHYGAGRLPDAQRALEDARSRHGRDHLARLYLGLTKLKDGQRDQGLRELEGGLKGLEGWLVWIDRYGGRKGQRWDPGQYIRHEIQNSLAMLAGRDTNLPELIASGEWIGRELEEEIDRVKRDRRRERFDDSRRRLM